MLTILKKDYKQSLEAVQDGLANKGTTEDKSTILLCIQVLADNGNNHAKDWLKRRRNMGRGLQRKLPQCPTCGTAMAYDGKEMFQCKNCIVQGETTGKIIKKIRNEQRNLPLCPRCRRHMAHTGNGTYKCKKCQHNLET